MTGFLAGCASKQGMRAEALSDIYQVNSPLEIGIVKEFLAGRTREPLHKFMWF
jgi:type IV pilus biogenesis protein CpaD/CtpE